MVKKRTIDVIKRHLDDAIAAERNFAEHLRGLLRAENHSDVQEFFEEHIEQTGRQIERLVARLQVLGGSPSTVKTFLVQLFSFATAPVQWGHEGDERTTQDLITTFAVEQAEIAMYQALARIASLTGDVETEQMAYDIQEEERQAAVKVWDLLSTTARIGFLKVTSGEGAMP
jgi:ferritin-like metal-binding protein YciE